MTPAKIKIPKGLATAVSNSPLLKPVAVFVVLKSIYRNGACVPNWNKAAVAKQLNISQRTLYTHVGKMQRHGLCYTTGNNLFLASWEKLFALVGMSDTLNSHFIKFSNEQKFEYVLKGLAIMENYNGQEQVIRRIAKMELGGDGQKNDLALSLVDKHISAEIHRSIEAFKQNKVYDPFFNPDVSISQFRLTRMLCTRRAKDEDKPDKRGNSGGTYWTKRLSHLVLIKAIERDLIECDGPYKEHRRKHRLGVIRWVESKQKHVLKMRNKIEFKF